MAAIPFWSAVVWGGKVQSKFELKAKTIALLRRMVLHLLTLLIKLSEHLLFFHNGLPIKKGNARESTDRKDTLSKKNGVINPNRLSSCCHYGFSVSQRYLFFSTFLSFVLFTTFLPICFAVAMLSLLSVPAFLLLCSPLLSNSEPRSLSHKFAHQIFINVSSAQRSWQLDGCPQFSKAVAKPIVEVHAVRRTVVFARKAFQQASDCVVPGRESRKTTQTLERELFSWGKSRKGSN